MIIQYGEVKHERCLEEDRSFRIEENTPLHLIDLNPHSKVEISWTEAGKFTTRELHVNADGELSDLLKKIDMEGRGGNSLEITCSITGGRLTWILEIEYAHLIEQEVQKMVRDLGHPDYQYEVFAEVLSSVKFLEERVNKFVGHWNHLADLFQSIARQPSESIEFTEGVQSIRNSFRLTPQTLRENLRKGLLNAEGKPTGKRIVAQKYHPTLDNAENSYVVQVIGLFQNARKVLYGEILKENKRLQEEKRRYEDDFRVPKNFGSPIKRTSDLLKRLGQLQSVELPKAWRSLKSLPNRNTNMVRFSPSYRGVAALEDALSELDLGIPRERRLRRLGELGQRKTWRLYEYWMVRKIYDALISLQFREKSGHEFRAGDGFRALENEEGPLYGLVSGRSITLKHKDVCDLQIHLTYELEFATKEGRMRPDLILELEYGDGEKNTTLILDAKYSRLGRRREYTQSQIRRSARRYRNGWVTHKKDNDAMAFLCHLGDEVWPACPEPEGQQGILLRKDFPFCTGILKMTPENSSEATYRARRLITAWLFRNRIIAICFSCGNDTKKRERIEEKVRPSGSSEYPVIRHKCAKCDLGIEVNFCGTCARGGSRKWEPILKLFPVRRESVEERAEWLSLVDIVRGEGRYRNCPSCGSRR